MSWYTVFKSPRVHQGWDIAKTRDGAAVLVRVGLLLARPGDHVDADAPGSMAMRILVLLLPLLDPRLLDHARVSPDPSHRHHRTSIHLILDLLTSHS